MNAVHKAIAHTRRRVFFDTWLYNLGWLALLWVGLALLILLCDRLASLSIPLPGAWVYGAFGGVLFVLAPILAWSRRPNDEAAASMMDDRLGLKDSLGTALFAEELKGDPFAKQVLDDADRLASKTRIEEAFAIRLGKGWGYAMPAAAIFALLMAFLPGGVDLLGLEKKKTEEQQQQAQAEQVQRQVLQANALLKEVQTEESELVEADPDDVFKELASLTDRDLANPDFKRETVSKLADVQDKLAAAEKSKQQQIKTAKNQMSRLNPGERGPADRFADAMRRGDFEAAKKELQRLADSLESMPDSEKKLLQQQLQNMSDQIQEMADQQEQFQQQAEQNIQQQLQQAGLSQQQIQQLQQQGYNQQAVQQAVQQSLQQQGMSQQQAQQQAQQTAQQVQQQQQQSQNANQSMQQNQGLSSSFGQMAQSLGPQGQQQQGQQNQQGQQQSQQGQQGQQNQQGQQQGQQQSQFSQGAFQSQQQLNQMSQMQQQLNQMQSAQQQLQQAMQGMNQPGQNQGQGGQPGQGGGGQGGKEAGDGIDNNPLGQEYQTGPYATYTESDIQQGQGRVIASWQENGEMSSGEATVEFDKAITDARTDAEHAVTEDRVPRRYHDTIKDYFQQLPDSPDQVRKAPAAPR